jgi:hypothetical protein
LTLRMATPLINKKFLLHKYPGKGGWTYAVLPDIRAKGKKAFGWKKVKGTIDGVKIEKYHLMPMKGGTLFLPVKAEIRKKIKKEAGDYVHVILYPDTSVLEVPDEMLMCLQDEPRALKFFNSLSESERRLYIIWVYEAKKIETRTARLVKAIEKLLQGKKMYEKKEE